MERFTRIGGASEGVCRINKSRGLPASRNCAAHNCLHSPPLHSCRRYQAYFALQALQIEETRRNTTFVATKTTQQHHKRCHSITSAVEELKNGSPRNLPPRNRHGLGAARHQDSVAASCGAKSTEADGTP